MLFIAILKLLVPYISLSLIPVFWGMSDGRRNINPIKYAVVWHRYKWIVHVLIGVYVYCNEGIKVTLIFMSWYWIIFDICENLARERSITSIGSTAFLDRIFPNFWVQFSIKITLLILSILWLLF